MNDEKSAAEAYTPEGVDAAIPAWAADRCNRSFGQEASPEKLRGARSTLFRRNRMALPPKRLWILVVFALGKLWTVEGT